MHLAPGGYQYRDSDELALALMDGQQQAYEELQQQLIEAIRHARYGIPSEEDWRLICWGAGVNYDKDIKHGH